MTVRVHDEGRCRVILLDQPGQRNALLRADWRALREATVAAGLDPGVDALVLTGAGSVFCAGADLAELGAASGDARTAGPFVGEIVGALDAVRRCAKPVVAALNGRAVGGGAELALACDLRIGVETASLRFPMLELGVVLDRLTLRTMMHMFPLGLVQKCLLMSSPVESETALSLGVLTDIVEPDRLLPGAIAIASRFACLDRSAVAETRQMINQVIFEEGEDLAQDMISSIARRGARTPAGPRREAGAAG